MSDRCRVDSVKISCDVTHINARPKTRDVLEGDDRREYKARGKIRGEFSVNVKK